jgi:cellulose synthase/poly-beta-1,6-N-acetylglucosamine synthase-like glycosyltransferase
MTTVADVLLAVAALPVLLASAYLLLLALSSWRPRPPDYGMPHLRFDLVVPAHDEEAGIAATVRSLLSVDYPVKLRRVVVVADNCGDQTAERALEAGAVVLPRRDAQRRGKGYALSHAFAQVLADRFADAVVVIDADTVVTPNLLHAFAARLDGGALAVQADNGVGNPHASWRTRLMAVAFVLFNTLRSLGRDRLGCSTGLRGNGMCLSTRLLKEVPHDAYSIVEDLEYGIRIGLRGHRVRFAPEARVLSVMTVGSSAASSQRRRWEGGRLRLARLHALRLLRRAIAARSGMLLDLALDLLVPPLAYLAAAAFVGTAVAALASWAAGRPLVALWAWGASLAGLCLYVGRGWWLSGTGLRGLGGLLYAPAYLAWKLGLVAKRMEHAHGAWIRTPRERRSG